MLNAAEAEEYVSRASSSAVADVGRSLERHGGRLLTTRSWNDDDGHWLEVRGVLADREDVEIRYARVLLLPSGPDKDAELEATIYGSGFEERLHTRAGRVEPVDGVITL